MNQHDLSYQNDEIDDSGAWLSIGDLMSALLMIFALLMMVTLTQLSHQIQQEKESRILIIKALTDAMHAKEIDAKIDPQTGDVSIQDSLLFDQRDSKLKPDGVELLNRFIPVYSEVIFSNETISKQVARLVIEGHTSSEGDYAYNMALSLDRAKNVLLRIDSMTFPNKMQFLSKLMPAGRGEIDADQQSQLPSDRKVLFRFQLAGDSERFVRLLKDISDE